MQLDMEPIGQDANQSSYLMTFFDQVRAGFHNLGLDNKLTSFTPSKCGTRNIWWSSPEFYYTLGGHLDLLCAMTYDTGITNGSVYQSWVQDQTTNILDAVSGKPWNNDAVSRAGQRCKGDDRFSGVSDRILITIKVSKIFRMRLAV